MIWKLTSSQSWVCLPSLGGMTLDGCSWVLQLVHHNPWSSLSVRSLNTRWIYLYHWASSRKIHLIKNNIEHTGHKWQTQNINYSATGKKKWIIIYYRYKYLFVLVLWVWTWWCFPHVVPSICHKFLWAKVNTFFKKNFQK